MWCDYLRCLYSFLKTEVDLCFKFDLREILDIRDFLKETTSALKSRFDCILINRRAFFKSTLRFGENFGPTLRFGKIFHLLYGSTRFALKEARAAAGWFFFIVLRN